MTKNLILGALLALCLMFTGCPDYSHLRETPDYQNMSDSGGETDEKADETLEATGK